MQRRRSRRAPGGGLLVAALGLEFVPLDLSRIPTEHAEAAAVPGVRGNAPLANPGAFER